MGRFKRPLETMLPRYHATRQAAIDRRLAAFDSNATDMAEYDNY